MEAGDTAVDPSNEVGARPFDQRVDGVGRGRAIERQRLQHAVDHDADRPPLGPTSPTLNGVDGSVGSYGSVGSVGWPGGAWPGQSQSQHPFDVVAPRALVVRVQRREADPSGSRRRPVRSHRIGRRRSRRSARAATATSAAWRSPQRGRSPRDRVRRPVAGARRPGGAPEPTATSMRLSTSVSAAGPLSPGRRPGPHEHADALRPASRRRSTACPPPRALAARALRPLRRPDRARSNPCCPRLSSAAPAPPGVLGRRPGRSGLPRRRRSTPRPATTTTGNSRPLA